MTFEIKSGRPSGIDNPAVKKEVIRRAAMGEKQTQIGRAIGVDRRTVKGWLKDRDDIRQLIEQEQMTLLESVPDAVDYVKSLIPENGKGKDLGIKEKELAYKASSDLLKAGGIMPSPVQSQVITNIYGETSVINPVIMQLLEDRDRKFLPIDEVVDVKEEEKG